MHDECVTPDAGELALALAAIVARHDLALGGGRPAPSGWDTESAAISTSSPLAEPTRLLADLAAFEHPS